MSSFLDALHVVDERIRQLSDARSEMNERDFASYTEKLALANALLRDSTPIINAPLSNGEIRDLLDSQCCLTVILRVSTAGVLDRGHDMLCDHVLRGKICKSEKYFIRMHDAYIFAAYGPQMLIRVCAEFAPSIRAIP